MERVDEGFRTHANARERRPPAASARAAARMLVIAIAALCAGCADLGYYWQSVRGHVGILRAAQPIEHWLDDAQAPAALKAQLALAQRMRRFAVTQLGLPDNASYTAYADLHRRAAVWNVVAAPAYSLTLQTWCFPIAGCVSYRGYYDEADAQAQAQELRGRGLEAAVYPVPAYSTLGWLNWAGGDPLLSTFIGYPEGELARIIFHELAHQVVYVPDDTTFNESYASAVERLGTARWLAGEADATAREEYARLEGQRAQFRALALETRERLQQIYDAGELPRDEPMLSERKTAVMADFRVRYAQLHARWNGPRRDAFDPWVANANNALFGALAAYDELEPAFEALFERERRAAADNPWPRFHAAVKRLAALPPAEREHELRAELQAQ